MHFPSYRLPNRAIAAAAIVAFSGAGAAIAQDTLRAVDVDARDERGHVREIVAVTET
ncbi:MAG: hypothetical protein WAK32_15775 [Xanthobacteraceae bacterium]